MCFAFFRGKNTSYFRFWLNLARLPTFSEFTPCKEFLLRNNLSANAYRYVNIIIYVQLFSSV